MRLYSYWRSSSAWRVRIALALKGIEYEYAAINLAPGRDEQRAAAYRTVNPQMLVPALQHGDLLITQSLLICDWLEAWQPLPSLLPDAPEQALQVREFCLAIACEIQPLNNLRVLNHLKTVLGANQSGVSDWYQHWIRSGFETLESRLQNGSSRYAFGEQPGLAECFLIPQIYNARRFECPLESFPRLLAIDAACASLPAFRQAHPDAQPDAPNGDDH